MRSAFASSGFIKLAGGGLFILGLITGIIWLLHARNHVWTNDAFIDGYQVAISSDLEARLITLYVDEGDAVVEGQLLCQLDESILLSQKREAKTAVLFLRNSAALEDIRKEKMKDIYLVAQQEYEHEIISFLDFDQIEKDFKAAEMRCKVAKASLMQGIAQLGVIEEKLRHTHVYAPRNGQIAKRWVVAGDVVQIGQPLLSLTDVEHIWVTANLEETKVSHLKQGSPVTIHIDAYPHRTFSGAVYVVRAAAASQFALIPPDNATGNFTKVVQRVPIKIWLDPVSESLYLYPGMSVEVTIHTK